MTDLGTGGRHLGILLALTTVLASCGGSPDTLTSPSSGPSAEGPDVIEGTVVDTVRRNPVPGALIDAGSVSVRADGSGTFRLAGIEGTVPVTLSAPGHVTRNSFLSGSIPNVTLDLIETDTLWNLDFYRELVRDGAGGGRLKPLNRWTTEPSFYIDRSPESGSNREIPDDAVELVVEAIKQVLPLLTSGLLTGSQIEIGTNPPADRTPGSAIVRWDPVEIAESAGAASGITRGVGGDASVVVLRSIEETRVIFHELGHVLGLYHPLGGIRPSLMAGPGEADPPHFTEWDVFHAKVLYARPPGNTDVDNDPSGFILGANPLGVRDASELTIVCVR